MSVLDELEEAYSFFRDPMIKKAIVRIEQLEAARVIARDHFENEADTVDGKDAKPEANTAMQLCGIMNAALDGDWR